MSKKTKINPEEIADFLKAVKDVKPLAHNKVRLTPSRQQTSRIKETWEESLPLNLNESDDLVPVNAEAFMLYKQASVSHKTLRKLRKGQYNVEAVLDLHGMTVEEARIAVDHFLRECLHENIRVVLIIHGKGHHSEMPILKNKLNHWLRQIETVLAFCSAASVHGSRGALYVLIKRTEEEKFVE